MFKSLFITCDQATTICDKSQYGEASFTVILQSKLHFLKCKICALYTKQNTLITKICDHQLKETKAFSLSQKDKELLKDKLSKKE